MIPHGMLTDFHYYGDLFISQPLGNPPQNLQLLSDHLGSRGPIVEFMPYPLQEIAFASGRA